MKKIGLISILLSMLNADLIDDKEFMLRELLNDRDYSAIQISKITDNKFLIDKIVKIDNQDKLSVDELMLPQKKGKDSLSTIYKRTSIRRSRDEN